MDKCPSKTPDGALDGIRPSCYTTSLIQSTGEYTLNIPRKGMEDITSFCGRVSGREQDKFAEMGLTVVSSQIVAAPIIGECGVHLECRKTGTFDIRVESVAGPAKRYYEEHDIPEENYHKLCMAEVVAICADEDCVGFFETAGQELP